MDLGFTEEQLATLMEGYKAMNGDASASDIVADLGIQDYVEVSNGELTSKPVETAVTSTPAPDVEVVTTSGSAPDAGTTPTVDATTTDTPVTTVDVQATTGATPDAGTTPVADATTTTPDTGTTTTNPTNDFGIPDINYVPENPSPEVDIDLSKVGEETESTPTTPTTPTAPTGGNNTTGSNNSTPRSGSNGQTPTGGNTGRTTGSNTGTTSPTTTGGTRTGGGTGNSTELDIEAIKRHIKNNLKPDFSNMKKACNDFEWNINDLQNWFYGPAEADCTSAYKAIKQDYGSESEKGKGIVGSIRSAFDWVDYCDQYISQWEKEQKSGNTWV